MADTKKNILDKWHRGHLAFLSVIIGLTFLAYSGVLHGEPIFDDAMIFDNIQSPYAFKELNLWEAFKGGMRPVTSFTFSLNYYFFGNDTFSYHLTNLLIHIINGTLVYLFIWITLVQNSVSPTTPAPPYQGGDKWKVRDGRQWTAFLTALLFSLHPIQTESVSYIYQRAESLSSLFYLVSFISFIIAVRQSEVKGFTTSIICYLIFILGFLLALGSKEIAITLPATAAIYGIFFFEKKGVWKKLAVPGVLILAGLIVAAVRLTTLREDPSAGYYLKEFTAWEYLLTQFSAITNYLRLLVLPVGQNIDHAYPASRSIFEIRTILSLAFLSSLLFALSVLYRRWRAGSFFILWFFIILLPSSSIVPLSDAFVEHRVYLSAMGIFFIISSGIVKIVELHRAKTGRMISVPVLSILVIISLLWVATYSRNRLWTSTVAMWQDSVNKSPNNARAHNSLGVGYRNKGLFDMAIESHRLAIKLRKDYVLAHNNLGNAYSEKGWIDKAIEEHQIAVRLDPGDLKANNNLGIDYFKKGMLDNAIGQFEAVLRLKPDHVEAQNNLGNCYFVMSDYKRALKEYLKTLRVDPKYFDAYYNVGLSLRKVGAPDVAIEFFVVFVRYGPDRYANEKRELAIKYNITENMPLPDMDLLIDRATKALNQLGES